MVFLPLKWKDITLIMALVIFVLAVNHAVIAWDMMYVEQPIIYTANQQIHSVKDLLHVYLHPLLLDYAIPFFRPSGHFLMYQLLVPLVGWHNTKALLMVNLVFLALTGYLIIKLYALLFRGLRAGGFIAFAFYLMQPALVISRFTLMHFEFAYIFFSMLSLYVFALFCEKNNFPPDKKSEIKGLYLFLTALIFYVIAVTFKEPALLVGPALGVYYIFYFYGTPRLKDDNTLKILGVLACTSLAALFYISLSWPVVADSIRGKSSFSHILDSGKVLFSVLLSAQNYFHGTNLFNPGLVWRHEVVPLVTRCMVWGLLVLTVWSGLRLLQKKECSAYLYKKSLIFLMVCTLIFLILPVFWGMGLPWHASLALIFFGLILGFGGDYFFHEVCHSGRSADLAGLAFALVLGLSTLTVNQVNILHLGRAHENHYFLLDKNAIFNPPPIKKKLSADSVIVIEDSARFGGHNLGDSNSPGVFALSPHSAMFNIANFFENQKWLFIKLKPYNNATLFSWAYELPDLKEDVYQFKIDAMNTLPDEVIYLWLRQFKNIVCLGYDANFKWHDRTDAFKQHLLAEQKRRHLVVNQYARSQQTVFRGKPLSSYQLIFAETDHCQFICDQKNSCKGFTFDAINIGVHAAAKCHFYAASAAEKNKMPDCPGCAFYLKS